VLNILKKEKLLEMLRALQSEDDEYSGFNEFCQFCEDFLFEAIEKGYLLPIGKKELKSQIISCFQADENIEKYCDQR
jgi:hypothetical protein